MMTVTREPQQDQVNGNAPWWARTIWVVGPITIIALGLVYLLASEVRSDVRMNLAVSMATKERLDAHQEHTEQLHQNIESYMRVQNLLTRQLCVNSAKNGDERAACFKQ